MRYESKNARKARKRNAARKAHKIWFRRELRNAFGFRQDYLGSVRELCNAFGVPQEYMGLMPRRTEVVIHDEVQEVPTLAASALESWVDCPRKVGFSKVFAAPYGERAQAYDDRVRASSVSSVEMSASMASMLHRDLQAATGRPLAEVFGVHPPLIKGSLAEAEARLAAPETK